MDLRPFEQKITDSYLKAALKFSKREIPGFTIKFKDKSRFMWLTNRYARLFNPTFMTNFHTTVGTTWYVISEEQALRFQRGLVDTLLHEATHMYDRKENGFFKYNGGYLFPQILALLALPLIVLPVILIPLMPNRWSAWVALVVGLILNCLGAAALSPWLLLFLLPLVALAPWPSPGRTKWERRGYAMSAAVEYWMNDRITGRSPKYMSRHFTGWNYYRMCPNEEKVIRFLTEDIDAIKSGEIAQDPWFRQAYKVILKVRDDAKTIPEIDYK